MITLDGETERHCAGDLPSIRYCYSFNALHLFCTILKTIITASCLLSKFVLTNIYKISVNANLVAIKVIIFRLINLIH